MVGCPARLASGMRVRVRRQSRNAPDRALLLVPVPQLPGTDMNEEQME